MIAVGASSLLFNRPPPSAIVFHNVALTRTVVQAGDDLEVSFTYDKRPGCAGPDARGEYYFRVWYADGNSSSLRKLPDGRSASADPAGEGHRTSLVVRLGHILPPLQPGDYALQLVGAFTCMGEHWQNNTSPMVPFRVTG